MTPQSHAANWLPHVLGLYMEIRELMPRGWGVDAFEHAHVFGSFTTDVGPEFDLAADRVFAALDALAPRGWLPRDPTTRSSSGPSSAGPREG